MGSQTNSLSPRHGDSQNAVESGQNDGRRISKAGDSDRRDGRGTGQAGDSFRDGICGICPAGCWVRAHYKDGKMTGVQALPDHPLGMLCTIGRHSADVVYDPKRVLHPLKRVGAKGNYEFERISWDEAYDTIVDHLQKTKLEHGAEATAIYTGRGSFDMAICDLFQPADVAISSASSVLFPFGSPNTLGVGALCYVSFAMIAPHVTMGEMYFTMDTDIEQAELVVVWGSNPATDSPPLAFHQIVEAQKRGAEVVVIDPRRSETAREMGAEWIPVRPGTDGALALGLSQVMLEEELFDEDFARDWTHGFKAFEQMVQHYRPEVVEGICGVPADTIRSLARRLAAARGAVPVMYSGLEYSDSGVQAIRAVFAAWALAGQLDVPGGLLFRMKENSFPQHREGLIPNPDVRKALGRDRFPVYSMYRGESHAIALPDSVLKGEPYKIRDLIILGASMITSWPNPEIWRKTLGSLDFLVCIDRYLTADAAYADIVLPAATGYEITSFMRYGPLFKIREQMVEPRGEARNDFLILAELAQRLGYGHLYPQTEEEVLEWALKGSGHTVEEVRAAGGSIQKPTVMMEYKKWQKGRLRADGKPGFDTPTGKFELASTILEEHGYDSLPVYSEPREGPLSRADIREDFPLVFSSGSRTFFDFRSQHHGVKSLVKHHPDPLVALHPLDAAARGISDGDWVWVATPRGQVKFRARVTEDIVPGSVETSQGGGGPLGPKSWQSCNVNDLTDLSNYDIISGFPVYKTLLCEVARVEKGATRGAEMEGIAGDESKSGEGTAVVDGARDNAVTEASTRDNISVGSKTDPVANPDLHRSRATARTSRGARGTTSAPARARPEGGFAHASIGPNAPEMSIYLDHNATTPLDPAVFETMKPLLTTEWGNPSSIHQKGRNARGLIEDARRKVAQTLNCTARRVVFTGGGSEANNLAIKGALARLENRRRHIVCSEVEHPAVLATMRALEASGYRLDLLPVDPSGRVDPRVAERLITEETALVSVMMANNETGTIQPVAELVEIARAKDALFHCDAVQALGKIPLDVDALGVDLLSVSSHKIYGPKGVGALYVRKGIELYPIVHGGSQERGLRSGTENTAGLVGFGKACELALRRLNHHQMQGVDSLRDRLEAGIQKLVPEARRNGHPEYRLPNTTNLTLPGIRGESLVLFLDRRGVYFSSGSACKSGNPEPSHALLALGMSKEDAHCSVRFSLGVATTEEDIRYVLEALEKVLRDTFSAIRFVGCR